MPDSLALAFHTNGRLCGNQKPSRHSSSSGTPSLPVDLPWVLVGRRLLGPLGPRATTSPLRSACLLNLTRHMPRTSTHRVRKWVAQTATQYTANLTPPLLLGDLASVIDPSRPDTSFSPSWIKPTSTTHNSSITGFITAITIASTSATRHGKRGAEASDRGRQT
jgi:hypothetical protein